MRFWTDEGFVLRLGAMALAAGTLYVAQPGGKGRTWYERALVSLAGAVSTGAVSVLGSSPSKEHSESIADFEKRIAALEPPKPPTT